MFSFSSNFRTKNAALIQATASILTCMKKKATESSISGLGASVVLNMIAKVNVPSDHIFYFDNFFTSFDLMKVLTERSISASVTVRINRTNKCCYTKFYLSFEPLFVIYDSLLLVTFSLL